MTKGVSYRTSLELMVEILQARQKMFEHDAKIAKCFNTSADVFEANADRIRDAIEVIQLYVLDG